MLPEPFTILLVIFSGLATGTVLGLTGGGGSVLAVPLLIYVVGIKDPHLAIGTSAFAVAMTAIASMVNHWKRGNVRIKEGLKFAIPGTVGTLVGAQLGLLTPANSLILIFAAFMVIMGYVMLFRNKKPLGNHYHLHIHHYIDDHGRLLVHKKPINMIGFPIGVAAGYFGIGGGFLVVPMLMHSAGLEIMQAVGTSLLSVSMFGFSTAIKYLIAGNVDLLFAFIFAAGGVPGSLIGAKLATKIEAAKVVKIFGLMMILVAAYIISGSISI